MTLIDYHPSFPPGKTHLLNFVNNFFSFSFNNMYLYLRWFLYCIILTFILVESYCVFGGLVFIQYYIEVFCIYFQFIYFHCCMLLCKYIICLFHLILFNIWTVSNFLLFGTMFLWKWLYSYLLINILSVRISLMFMPSGRSVGCMVYIHL